MTPLKVTVLLDADSDGVRICSGEGKRPSCAVHVTNGSCKLARSLLDNRTHSNRNRHKFYRTLHSFTENYAK